MAEIYAGLMSGTSMDGVDGVLLDFSTRQPRVIHSVSVAMPAALRMELLALNTPGQDELHRAALATNDLVHLYSDAVAELLNKSGQSPDTVVAIGAHGQTVRHQPGLGYTLQLNNPALLAELTGIDVVTDFRSRCVAAGGQGAPLAPFFHDALFSKAKDCVAVLNLGGISNLTVLPPMEHPQRQLLGFDCGPGNALMDYWCQKHMGQPFDNNGTWAASGRVSQGLIDTLLSEPYFDLIPPKSTGRDMFNPDWLNTRLASAGISRIEPVDIQASLCELTVQSCSRAVRDFAPDAAELLICGGGAFNQHVTDGLQRQLPWCDVMSSGERGIPPMQVEAAAFAWLARKTMRRETLPLKSTTGAKGSRILGCIYPA